MVLKFVKMNGAGNDFVLLDNRDGSLHLDKEQIIRLCHRQRGVGADGVMLLIKNPSGNTEWAWDFFNSDGSAAEMCGNGARCFARYLQKVVKCKGAVAFESIAGVIQAELLKDKRVAIELTSPKDLKLGLEVPLSTGTRTVHFINTGVPHAVLFEEDVTKAEVVKIGAEVRYHAQFAPKGTNVNFVQVLGPNHIRVRTYERGVEGETLACGTGIVASALIASKVQQFVSPVKVLAQGGDTLEVAFIDAGDTLDRVRLTGPAEFVFEGKIRL